MAKFKNIIFESIHSNNLIYNTCWEDPKIDRKLLQLDESSKILMITSAGCNALDYVLDNPYRIDCVDMNPRQNALLELKMGLIKNTDHNMLFQFFGKGMVDNYKNIYEKYLRKTLSPNSSEYWDIKIKYFKTNSKYKSFYYNGTSGKFAWLVNQFLKTQPKLYKSIKNLFKADDLEEQTELYSNVEGMFNNIILKWILNLNITLSLLGVPENQFNLITNDYPDGLQSYLKEKFRQIFTQISIKDNYFWRVYLFGNYTRSCRPNYLKFKNFNILKKNLYKIHIHTNTITNFLEENTENYSHFVLLDHQDWLAMNNPEELNKEWEQILNNSQSGTKILFRSASFNRDFLPKFVLEKVYFDDELVAKYHHLDRVGTYGSTHLGIVK